MSRAVPLICAGYAALFVAYCAIRLTADWVRHVAAERRFRRYLIELQREADELLVANTLRRMLGGTP